MILTAHQPAYIPWLGYIHKIAISDIFVVADDVQFENESYISRNKIKTANGSIWLTVPIKKKGHMKLSIKDIEILNIDNWRKRHWNSIFLSYKKAPYFNDLSDFFNEIYKKDWDNLLDLTNCILFYILDRMRIQIEIVFASQMDIVGSKSDYVLDICKKRNADIFVFGSLGKNYADIAKFKSESISTYFQEYKHPVYPQLWGDFHPYMSVIDLIMNEGFDNSFNIIMENNVSKSELQKMI